MESEPVCIRPFGGALGGKIIAIDPSSPSSARVGEGVARALARYGVLFGCTRALGLENTAALAGLLGLQNRISGVAPGARPCSLADCRMPERVALMTDPLWRTEMPSALLLHADELPPRGGESIWSSLAGAYDGLSVPMRRYLATLGAAHGRPHGGKEVWRPLVATHPLTGEAYLGISPDFTRRLGGVPEDEGDAILRMLRNLLYLPENQIRVPWARGMFALWDCRIAHHYAVGGFAEGGWQFSGFSFGADPHPPPARIE